MNKQPNKQSNDSEHPDIRTNAPGRIPESLINAAIDGELNEDIQREIAHALNYDTERKQELIDTVDALNALQMPIATPDFSDAILTRADRHRRFIPATWRKHVRTGRLGVAAALLLTLMTVAGLQRLYPRLTTLASHPTPVLDIEIAMERDTQQLATNITKEAQRVRASVATPIIGFLTAPGQSDHRFEISTPTAQTNPSITLASGMRLVGFTRTVSAVYSQSNDQHNYASTRSPLCLFGSGEMNTWASSPHSSTRRFHTPSTPSSTPSAIEPDSTELDIAALP